MRLEYFFIQEGCMTAVMVDQADDLREDLYLDFSPEFSSAVLSEHERHPFAWFDFDDMQVTGVREFPSAVQRAIAATKGVRARVKFPIAISLELCIGLAP